MHRLITTTWLCVLGLMVSPQYCHAGSGLTFTASPYTIKTGLTKTAHMRCAVAASVSVAHVTSIVITYGSGHKYVASVTSNEAAKAFVTQGSLRVTGSVAGKGYLHLTWDTPSKAPTGTYTCEVTARSRSNGRLRLESTVKLSCVTPSNLELSQFIAKLRTCINPEVSFTARHKAGQTTYQSGNQVKYVHVVENINGNYNPSTSTFTCQEPGIYQFDVHAVSGFNKDLCLELYRNGAALTGLLGDDAKDLYSAASTSAVVKLTVGDKVVVKATCTAYLDADTHTSHDNSFSGVLIHSERCQI